MIRFPAIARHRHSLGAAVALIAISLLSASCIKVDIGIHLNADGSGTVSFLTAVDSTVADSLSSSFGGSAGSTGTDFTSIDKSKLPPGATVTPYSQGKFKGEQVTAPFKSADDLAGIIEQINASSGSSSDTPTGGSDRIFDSFSLKGTGESWTFDATVAPPANGQDLSSFGITPDQLKTFFKDASFTVRLKLPGSVSSSNADSNKGGELTWNLDIFATQPRTLSARSKPGSGGGFPVVPVVAVVVVAVAAGAVFMVVRRRRGIMPV